MPSPEKDQLAAEAMECWVDFQQAFPRTSGNIRCSSSRLSGRLRSATPSRQGRILLFTGVSVRQSTGLSILFEVECKRVPDDVLRDAERLECLLFSGYDPYFEGMNRQDCKGREEFDIVP